MFPLVPTKVKSQRVRIQKHKSSYRIVIPREMGDLLNLKANSWVRIFMDNKGKIWIEPDSPTEKETFIDSHKEIEYTH